MSQTEHDPSDILMAGKEISMADRILPVINKQKCILCGLCVDACPEGVLDLQEGELAFANPQDCVYCATCEETCPEGAVRCEFEIRWAS